MWALTRGGRPHPPGEPRGLLPAGRGRWLSAVVAAASPASRSRPRRRATPCHRAGPAGLAQRGDRAHRPTGDEDAAARQAAGTLEIVLQWAAPRSRLLVFRPGQSCRWVPAVPLLMWGAARLTPREVTVQLLAFFAAVSVLTSVGLGPSSRPSAVGAPADAHRDPAPGPGPGRRARHPPDVAGEDPAAHHVRQADPQPRAWSATSWPRRRRPRSSAPTSTGASSSSTSAPNGSPGTRADEVIGKATVALADFGDGRLRIAIGLGEDPDDRAARRPRRADAGRRPARPRSPRTGTSSDATASCARSRWRSADATATTAGPIGYLGVAEDVDRAASARGDGRRGPGDREADRRAARPGRPDQERLPVHGQPRAAHPDHEHPRLLPAAGLRRHRRPAGDAPADHRPHRAQRPSAHGAHRGHADDVAGRGGQLLVRPGADRPPRAVLKAIEAVHGAVAVNDARPRPRAGARGGQGLRRRRQARARLRRTC